ncbi:MAG: thioesterase family protein [Clostridia bacterium]|jgi:predicted thioesterase|nr:thioesterase family protein [Clostridia bacterium]MDH7572875.1 thioesterase family protein [Clostridia bacterium]
MPLAAGLRGEATENVTPENTAVAYGSGGVEVYATPAVVALVERAAVTAVEPHLEADKTTVGTRIDVRHLAATPVGFQVRAMAELVQVEGRHLVFHVEVYDEVEKVAEGTHERFLVDREKFLRKALTKG